MTDSSSNPTSAFAQLMLKIADVFESIILKVSAVCCWSSALLIVVIIANVTMRYGFENGLIIFEEIQWHLYAIGIMFGLSYAEITNSQVRVDVVASMLKPKTVLKWEIFGTIVFVFPTIFVILFNNDNHRVYHNLFLQAPDHAQKPQFACLIPLLFRPDSAVNPNSFRLLG